MEILQFTYSLGHPASLGGLFCAIGNPLPNATWTYTWEKGRQLKCMSKAGTTASFKYNENGLRIQKTVNSVVTNYTLHGKNIMHMTQGSNSLHFYYDASNKPAIVEFNGTKYAYVHNLQGDIVAILDSNGTAVVQYKYDAWGHPINKTGGMANTLGTVQPFRYRGYVYDEETGLYYLRSRFFSFVICRFLNADEILNGNIYAYCSNSPVAFCDASGKTCVCCFDENGFETTLMSLWMIGGGGGSMMAGAVGVYGYAGPDKALETLLYPLYFPEKVLAFVVDNWLQGLVSAGTLAIASAIYKASQTVGHPYVGAGLAIFYVATSAFVGNTIQEGISSLYQDDYSDNPGIGGITAATEDFIFYVLSLAIGESDSNIIESYWNHIKGLIDQIVEELEE